MYVHIQTSRRPQCNSHPVSRSRGRTNHAEAHIAFMIFCKPPAPPNYSVLICVCCMRVAISHRATARPDALTELSGEMFQGRVSDRVEWGDVGREGV